MRQKARVEEGSDCLIDQAGSGRHGRRSSRIGLRIVINLRAQREQEPWVSGGDKFVAELAAGYSAPRP